MQLILQCHLCMFFFKFVMHFRVGATFSSENTVIRQQCVVYFLIAYPNGWTPLHKLEQLGLGRPGVSQHQQIDVSPASKTIRKPGRNSNDQVITMYLLHTPPPPTCPGMLSYCFNVTKLFTDLFVLITETVLLITQNCIWFSLHSHSHPLVYDSVCAWVNKKPLQNT